MKIESFEDVEKAMYELALIETNLAAEEAAMNKEIAVIQNAYAEKTAKKAGEAARLNDEIEAFCKKNKDTFDSPRSLINTHGKIGFRTNPPKVVQLNKKWKVESTLAFIKELFGGKKYLRTKPEIDKEAILADYAKEKINDSDLAGVGLRVDQEETFFIEINWDSIKKQTKAA